MGRGPRTLIPDAPHLLAQLDDATAQWHKPLHEGLSATDPFTAAAFAVHRANFDLWHQEDEARNPHASDTRIAGVKRAIDIINQRRNDLVEKLDSLLHDTLPQNPSSPLHSETPGMIVDRLSIMSLKVFHTAEETMRESASEAHRQNNRARLATLLTQREDLALCLDALFAQIARGERRFKLYRQLKMYNDPDLNPVLYGRTAS